MQNISFAPPNLGLGDNKKNYVFVDEHNRHKRLKVMRACEGCRRRKIRCDAATTNAWPCAACVRLKLHCVPPRVNYDRSNTVGMHTSGLERVLVFDDSSGSGDEEYGQPTNLFSSQEIESIPEQTHPTQVAYDDGLGTYHTPPYNQRSSSFHDFSYGNGNNIPMSAPEQAFQPQATFQTPDSRHIRTVSNDETWPQEQYSGLNLTDALGELKITENGIAPYITQQKKMLAEAPALEEFEVRLPPVSRGSGSTVRIPPELMPDEDQAMNYLNIFFTEIHPYVPVISKPYFYRQWQTNRGSISPLILEAIFACAGRLSDDPAQGAQWLALASKHEDCFMDVPRLSTIQALLVLLKARESAPKRGYYYRSWMTIKTVVTMAKDLELHEHYADHLEGRPCGSDSIECLTKTRIWQNIFICEMMIGGPQGRFDLGVDPDTVEIGVHRSLAGIEESEFQVSRQFSYLVRCIRNVRNMTDVYSKIKKKKDWGTDPRFVELNPSIAKWHDDLPSDLQLHYPSDGSPPWLPSHFIANLHCYYHLTILILHRPQLMYSGSFSADGSWKQHMILCYASAKSMCRLQEGILQQFGLPGFLCMQRGINFTIYAVLTCTMLHLVALTSPDPDFNTDAKEYFTRHMRILESCTSSWPMPEMQAQIDALREAFSANINKPFELRASFPYGSPGSTLTLQPSPPMEMPYQHENPSQKSSREPPAQTHYSQPITPPISADAYDPLDHKPTVPQMMMMTSAPPQQQQQQQQQQRSLPDGISSAEDLGGWNPTRIFDQWNTAFGTPSTGIAAAAAAGHQPALSSPLNTASAMGSFDIPSLNDTLHHQQQQQQQQQQPYHFASSVAPLPAQVPQASHPAPYDQLAPSFVSPSMWRDTVASTYDSGGLKRRWDGRGSYLEGGGGVGGQGGGKRAR